ncbi:acetylxylan esterase, partial [Candidatus Poribacteria bacterium]|nr:acetylxylan esterase [Candidatus Poribacteria bacterium]
SAERPITSAGLHYAIDRGVWHERAWTSAPAEAMDGVAHAPLPAERPVVAYLTVEYDRGGTVSAEHVLVS